MELSAGVAGVAGVAGGAGVWAESCCGSPEKVSFESAFALLYKSKE